MQDIIITLNNLMDGSNKLKVAGNVDGNSTGLWFSFAQNLTKATKHKTEALISYGSNIGEF